MAEVAGSILPACLPLKFFWLETSAQLPDPIMTVLHFDFKGTYHGLETTVGLEDSNSNKI